MVNGGRVTSHVHTISKEQFQANFIPHDPGRHRVDVKFNGEKVPNSPWFVEVKDPNTPLLSPMLVANPAKARENGFGSHDTLPKPRLNDSLSTLNNRLSSSQSKLNTELKQNSLFQQSKELVSTSTSKFESSFSSSNNKSDLFSKTPAKSDFQKSEFGSFSLLETPKLLSGAKSSNLEDKKRFQSSSMDQLNSLSQSYSPRATYSTTIERSVNTGKNEFSKDSKFSGLSNGNSTMPKSSTFNKSIERRSSLHTKLSDPTDKKSSLTNGSGLTKSTESSGLYSKSIETNGIYSKSQETSNGFLSKSQGNSSIFSKSQESPSTFSKTMDGSSLLSRSQDKSNLVSKSQDSSSLLSRSQDVSMTTSSFSSSFKSSQNSFSKSQESKAMTVGPALTSYKGTAEKCKFVGETVRHFNAGKLATFEMFAPGTKKAEVDVNIISKYFLIFFLDYVSLYSRQRLPSFM